MRRFLIAGALLLAGCGGAPSSAEEFEGEERKVAEAVEEIQTASERRDGERLCRDLLARALRDELGRSGSSCDKEMEKAAKDADSYDVEVRDVTVTGTQAQVQVRGRVGKETRSATLRMVKEDGRWRAASLGG